MKRKFQKAAAFSGVLAITALLAFPGAAAETKPAYEGQVLLENQYDAEVDWNNGAVFVKNGSPDSITDKTELKLVKPDGSLSDLANTQKFDEIDVSLSDSKTSPYHIDSSYLIVGKDGKKALLKDDGSFVGNTEYDDISAATDNFMAVEKGGKYVVQKLDSTMVKEYDQPVKLAETDNSIIVISNSKVIGLFDKSGKEIDLTGYGSVTYSTSGGDYLETMINNKYGVISDTGKVIISPAFSYIAITTYKGDPYFNAITYENSAEKNTIYKSDGTVFLTTSTSLLSDNYVEDSGGYIPFYKDGGFGIYDLNTGAVKVEPIYSYIMACDNHCFAYRFNTKFGVKTYDDADIVPPGEFQDASITCHIGDNRILVIIPNKSAYVYAVDTGKRIKELDNYTDVVNDSGELMTMIVTHQNNALSFTYGLLDNDGNELFPSDTYDALSPCNNVWLVSKNGKIGLIEIDGLQVTEPVYQSLGSCSAGNLGGVPYLFYNPVKPSKVQFFCTKQNDKFGLLKIAPITYATGLSLDKTEASLNTGDTLTLKPTVSPADATNQKITWTSSDESVATVKDGVVTAAKAGTATITAKTEDGGFTATCTITVTEKATSGTTNPTNTTNTDTNTTGTGSQTGLTNTATTAAAAAATPGSPATGEPSLPFAVFAVIALSAFTAVIARIRKA